MQAKCENKNGKIIGPSRRNAIPLFAKTSYTSEIIISQTTHAKPGFSLALSLPCLLHTTNWLPRREEIKTGFAFRLSAQLVSDKHPTPPKNQRRPDAERSAQSRVAPLSAGPR